jgi:hypothetical protein
VISACIAAGAVSGRYHYVADVLIGAPVGVIGALLARGV